MGSEYGNLPLSDDLNALEAKIDSLLTAISSLEANLNSVGNGNPAQMYSYALKWSDATLYSDGGSTWTTKTSSSGSAITVDDMRFLMVRFEAKGTAGGGTGGSQRARAVLSSDHTETYYTTDLTDPVFKASYNHDDMPDAYDIYYGFIPVAGLTGDYTVLFQVWTSGGTTEIKNCYVYEQILI